MGRRGPPPKPTHLKLLAGNPGKRKLNRREPKPKGKPNPPSWLGKVAKVEWRRVMAGIPKALLTSVDRQILAQYCQNTARLAELEKTLTEHGYTFVTEKGYVCQRPEFTMIKTLQAAIVRDCDRLGFSPAARTRIEMPEEEPQKDATEELLFGKRTRGA